jgi:hypothetical protein
VPEENKGEEEKEAGGAGGAGGPWRTRGVVENGNGMAGLNRELRLVQR